MTEDTFGRIDINDDAFNEMILLAKEFNGFLPSSDVVQTFSQRLSEIGLKYDLKADYTIKLGRKAWKEANE